MAIKRKVPKNSTPVHNDIIRALCCVKLSSSEFNIIFAIVKKTYGWDKKMDWISLSQLEALTGIASRHCCSYVKKLVAKKVVLKVKGKIGLNKRTKEWVLHKRGVQELGVQEPGKILQELGKKLQELGDTKETITKETIQKKKYIKKKTYIPTQKLVETFNHDFELLKLTNEEMDKLHKKFGGELQANLVKFENAMGSRKDYQKKYSSHYRTMLNWYDKPKTKEFYEKEMIKLGYPAFHCKYGEPLANKYLIQ